MIEIVQTEERTKKQTNSNGKIAIEPRELKFQLVSWKSFGTNSMIQQQQHFRIKMRFRKILSKSWYVSTTIEISFSYGGKGRLM